MRPASSVREGLLNAADDGGFGGAVGVRHVVIDGLVFDFKKVEVGSGTGNFRGGASGGLDGNGDIGRGHIADTKKRLKPGLRRGELGSTRQTEPNKLF